MLKHQKLEIQNSKIKKGELFTLHITIFKKLMIKIVILSPQNNFNFNFSEQKQNPRLFLRNNENVPTLFLLYNV